ncbi:hypothetical protein ACFWN2_12865 [Lentzea sp. NPDC058436]|uniref:hypothetical protein n=1 Tax=Lentzea sp. NPDC058436 TaxID=3346499 RepID=UPI00364EC0D6
MDVSAQDVRLVRRLLLDDLRKGSGDGPPVLPPVLAAVVEGLTPAEIRTGLVLVVTRCRASGALSATDVRLWIDSSGLRGVRTGVRAVAARLRLSARHAHRRIRHCDEVVAQALSGTTNLGELVHAGVVRDRSEPELRETARAECLFLPAPERMLDALTAYHRNRRPGSTAASSYLAGNKDARYRDAGRVRPWLDSIATDPPLPSTTAADERVLLVCHGVELARDPHQALAQIDQAIWTRQRAVLPLLLAHAGRLITDVGAAGVDAWLHYLQVRYHAAMESENITALRYARAWQVDAARYSPLGLADLRVGRGMSGRGHVLQMFGHFDAAIRCFAAAARHASHFRARAGDSADEQELYRDCLQGAHAQLAYTEALRGGDRSRALTAMRAVHAVADDDDRVDVQFTRQRRALELALGFAVRRHDLVLAPAGRRDAGLVEDQFQRFVTTANDHPSPNRLLAAQDITLLYAVLTRDAALGRQAREAFQEINDGQGGYANLTHRFNSRLRAARALCGGFRDIVDVSGPPDPLRQPTAVPARATGFLVSAWGGS